LKKKSKYDDDDDKSDDSFSESEEDSEFSLHDAKVESEEESLSGVLNDGSSVNSEKFSSESSFKKNGKGKSTTRNRSSRVLNDEDENPNSYQGLSTQNKKRRVNKKVQRA
jgi:hypothetical protein